MESSGTELRYRWQFQKRHTVQVIVKADTEKIMEIIV